MASGTLAVWRVEVCGSGDRQTFQAQLTRGFRTPKVTKPIFLYVAIVKRSTLGIHLNQIQCHNLTYFWNKALFLKTKLDAVHGSVSCSSWTGIAITCTWRGNKLVIESSFQTERGMIACLDLGLVPAVASWASSWGASWRRERSKSSIMFSFHPQFYCRLQPRCSAHERFLNVTYHCWCPSARQIACPIEFTEPLSHYFTNSSSSQHNHPVDLSGQLHKELNRPSKIVVGMIPFGSLGIRQGGVNFFIVSVNGCSYAVLLSWATFI